jgi:CheY-like chemotaxis protein
MESDSEACRSAGMDDFLTKPIQREKLIACLAHWDEQKSNDAVT